MNDQPQQPTFPFLNFVFDPRTLDERVWVRVKEIVQLCHLFRQGAPAHADTWDIQALCDFKNPLDQSAYPHQEMTNIQEAYTELLRQATAQRSGQLGLSPQLICELHRKLYDGVEIAPEMTPGRYRQRAIRIVSEIDRMFLPCVTPEEVPVMLEKLCKWLNETATRLPQSMRLEGGILSANLFHLYFAAIHPFLDGNGRIARLLESYILVQSGFPAHLAHLPWNFYLADRVGYHRALTRYIQGEHRLNDYLFVTLSGWSGLIPKQVTSNPVDKPMPGLD